MSALSPFKIGTLSRSYIFEKTDVRPIYVSVSRNGDPFLRLTNSTDQTKLLTHPFWSDIANHAPAVSVPLGNPVFS